MLVFSLFGIATLLSCVAARPQRYDAAPFADVAYEKRASLDSADNSTDGPTVDLGYAVYQGVANTTSNLNVFKGIRFAAAPIGENRWKAPQVPPVGNGTVIQANAYGSQCPQNLPASAGTPGDPAVLFGSASEDCLFLNVYAPSNASSLPVLVWIHGGGYGLGNGQTDFTTFLNSNNNGLIVVSIQYRLGAFGFLAGGDIAAHGVLNAGIRDQAFALQWIQQYIELFGGDARRVTISGESAGAGSVMLLDLAFNGQLGTSLFEQSIVASPYLPMQQEASSWIPTQSYYAFAIAAGCPPITAYGRTNSTTIFQCLQSQDSATLINASALVSASGTIGTWGFLPVTDGEFITELPSKQLSQRKLNGLNILSGNNANEGPIFVPQDITTEEALVSWLALTFPYMSNNDIAKILLYYPSSNASDAGLPLLSTNGISGPTAVNASAVAVGQQQRANNIYAETTFVCPSYWLAEAYSDYSSPYTSNMPLGKAYKYQFSIEPALHGSDVEGYFGALGIAPFSSSFSLAFQQIWGNFIMNGNPSISEATAVGAQANGTTQAGAANAATTFPEFSVYNPYMINLNQTGGVTADGATSLGINVTAQTGEGATNDFTSVNAYTWEGGRGYRCDFWRSVGAVVPG